MGLKDLLLKVVTMVLGGLSLTLSHFSWAMTVHSNWPTKFRGRGHHLTLEWKCTWKLFISSGSQWSLKGMQMNHYQNFKSSLWGGNHMIKAAWRATNSVTLIQYFIRNTCSCSELLWTRKHDLNKSTVFNNRFEGLIINIHSLRNFYWCVELQRFVRYQKGVHDR